MSYLGILSDYVFTDISKNSIVKLKQLENVKTHYDARVFELGKQQPFPFDYPYINRLKNLYGDPKYQPKGLVGVPYTTPYRIRPPNMYIKNDNNAILDNMRNSEVEVSGYTYNIKDVPFPRPRIIS